METNENQALTSQDSREELKESQDQIESSEADSKEKEEYSIGASGAQSDEEDEYAINLEEDDPSSTSSSTGERINIDSFDDGWKHLEAFSLLDSEVTKIYYEQMVYNSWCSARTDDNIRSKMESSKEVLDTEDSMLGLVHSTTDGDSSASNHKNLRNLLSYRASYYSKKKLVMQDKILNRLEILRRIATECKDVQKDFKENELDFLKKEMFQSALPKHVQVGLKMTLRLVMSLMTTVVTKLNAETIIDIIDTLYETLSELPAGCLRDTKNQQIDSVTVEGVTHLRKWMITALTTTQDKNLKEKLFKLWYAVAIATGTLDDVLPLLNGLLLSDPSFVSAFPAPLGAELQKLNQMSTKYDLVPRTLLTFRYFHWPPAPDEKTSSPSSQNTGMASDGSFIYIHDQRGLVKLGTGYNDTKQNQVYAIRRKWRPSEKGWMFFAAGKLYYRSTDIKPNAFITINTTTLEEEEQIPGEKEGTNVLKAEAGETRSPATSDGRYIYVIEIEKNQAGDTKFKVHKFDPLNKFQHLGVAEMQSSGSNQPIENNNIISASYVCNGNRLATLLPTQGVQCRIFEYTENPAYNPKQQKDSKEPSTPFIWNETEKSDAWTALDDYYAPAMCACTFDYPNNSLWILNNNGIIKRYLNEGLTPKYTHLPAPAFPIHYEHVMAKYPLPEGTAPVSAEQASITFLANMQRLAAEWSFQYPDLDDPEYEYPLNSALVIQSDEKSINNLCDVIEKHQQVYFDGVQEDFFLKRYALHTYLVLLKLNLFRPFKSVRNNTAIKDRVTNIIHNFMNKTPKTTNDEADFQASQAITRAAADLLIVALDLVYPTKEAQTALLHDLLGKIGNPTSDAFLHVLLGGLAHGNKIGLFPPEYEHSTSTLKQLAVLADSYLKGVVKSTEEKVNPTVTQSRALSLLFYYQKWLIQNLTQMEEDAAKKKLAVLATVLFEQAVETLARVIDLQGKLKLDHDGVWELLKESVVGSVLPYLVLGLSLTSDPLVTVELIPALSKVAIQLDQLNQQIKAVHEEKRKDEKKEEKKEDKKEEKPSDNLTQIEGMSVWLLAKLAGGMVTGPAVSEAEKENSQLLSSELFAKGLDSDKEETTEAHFLKDFVEAGSEETRKFFLEIRSKALSATEIQLLKRKENPALDRVERYVLAALLKHNGLISLALYHCKDSQDNLLDEEEEEEFIDLLVPLWRAAHKVRKWLIQEIQAAASDQSHDTITEEAINKAKFLIRLGSVAHATPITPSEAISLRRSSQSVALRQSGSDSLRKSGVIANSNRWKISVQSLRTWADFFGVWKAVREKSSLGNTVTDDIISVVQSTTKSEVFVKMINERKERAKCRISGFQAFHTLLNIIQQTDLRFDIVNQLLQGLRSTDYLTHVHAHHFLQDLEGIGQEASNKVKESFLQLLDNLLGLIADAKSPANLRVMALDALNLQFKPQDNQFLLEKKVPELLLKYATEELGTDSNDKKKLQEAAWLAFRLLGVQAIESDADGKITDELLRLLSTPLQRAEQYYQSVKRSKSQKWIEHECIRILQFLTTVSSKAQCMEYLAKTARLTQLLNLVKHGSAKVQLIAFRLLRKVLAVRDPATLDIILDNKSILDFFLEIIGIAYATSSTLFSHRIDVTVRLTHDIVSIASEAVMLFRHLLKSSTWSDYLTKFIRENLGRIPAVVKRDSVRQSALSASDLEAMLPAMAALCLLGGDIDVIRIGGKVMVKSKTDKLSPDSSYQIGTVVEYNALSGTAKVVLDNITPVKAAEYSSNVLTAISEIAFEPRNFAPFSKELADLFKFFLSTEGSDDLVLLQFKSRSFKILGNYVKAANLVKDFVDENLLKNLISFSMKPTKDKPKLNLEQLEKVAQTLQDLLLPVRSTVTARLGWLPPVQSMKTQVENLISDGKLTQQEYEALHLEFTQLDLNGDGEVTVEEFKEANLKRGSKVTDQDVAKLAQADQNKLNFLGFMQVIIGKAITSKPSDSQESAFHLEIKSPLPLAATYKIKECNLGTKLSQDDKSAIDAKLVIFNSNSPASVNDKLVVLQQDDTLLANLKLIEQNGAKAVIVIVESELNHEVDNEANKLNIPVAVATVSEMDSVINYIQPTKGQKSGETVENKDSPYKQKLIDQGYPEDQVTSALAKFATPVLAAAYLVENVKKSKKKSDDEKSDEKDDKSDTESDTDNKSESNDNNKDTEEKKDEEKKDEEKKDTEEKKDEEEKKENETEKKEETKAEEKTDETQTDKVQTDEVKTEDKKDEETEKKEETKAEEKKDDKKDEDKKDDEKKEDKKEDDKEEEEDIAFDSYDFGNDEGHFFQPYEAKDESTWPAAPEDNEKPFDPRVEINLNNPRGEAIDIESSLCQLYGRHAVVGLLVQMKENKELLAWAAQTDFLPQIVKLAATSEDWVSARVNYRNEVLPVVADILKLDTDGKVTKSLTQEVIGTLTLSSFSTDETSNKLDLNEPNVEFAVWLLQQLVQSSNQYISEQSPILLKILLGCLEKTKKETRVKVCQLITQLLVVSKNVDQSLFKRWKKLMEEIHSWEVESSTAPTAKKFTQALAEMLVIADLHSDETETPSGTTSSEVSMERYFRDFGDISTRGTKEWNLYGTNGYSTFVATNVSLTRGKWYYEVELDNSYSTMIGWTDANSFIAIPDKVGVGDTDDSWGYCGNRQVVMHGAARTSYHSSYYWKSGDVVGVYLNADIGQVRFSMNDKLLDVAFENIDIGSGLTPALTLESGMRAYVKFDRSTMKYIPRGFKTIGEYKPKNTAPSSWKNSIKLLYKLMTALINKEELPAKVSNAIFQQFGKSDEDQKLISSKYFLEWPVAADEQLITFAQSHTKGSRLISMKAFAALNTQTLETLGVVKNYLLREHKLSFSKTESLPPIVILRMKVLMFLNEQLKSVARFINFDDVDKPWTFAGKLKQLKGLLFFRIKKLIMIPLLKKMDMSRSYWSSSESIELNRMLAVRQKEKGWKAGDELSTMFGQFFKKVQEIEKREPKFWYFRDRLWTTSFVGEGGVDQGGLYNESISAFCSEMQSNAMSLFIQTPNGTHKVGNNREKFIPRSSANSPTQIALYRLLGKMMAALGIRGDYPLPLHFPSMVWKQILGETITENDLRDVDLMCLNTLDALRNIDKEGVTADAFSDVICEVFAIQSSDGREVELKENGKEIPVTFENRHEWADLVVKFRLSEFKSQVDAIVSGMNSILPIKLMQWLMWWELEEMVTGKPALDLEKLKKMTDYGDGYSATHPVIVLFWKVLESFTPEEQSAFLRFTWGRSRLPERLTDQFKMRKLYCSGNPDEYLPKSHTCGFAFDLPEYTNFEVMREKLIYAIHECAAVDGDFNAGNVDTWA